MSDKKTELSLSVAEGKYTVQFDADGRLRCLRYGQPWRDLTGDGMVLAMAHEIERLRERLKLSNDYLKASWQANALVAGMSSALIQSLNDPV